MPYKYRGRYEEVMYILLLFQVLTISSIHSVNPCDRKTFRPPVSQHKKQRIYRIIVQ
jgi:hypothetical protein